MTKSIIILACAIFAVTACGKKSKGGGGPTATTTYYQSDNTCYATSTNEEVDMDKCDGLKFYLENGECYTKADDEWAELNN